jgi:hypothetical protein
MGSTGDDYHTMLLLLLLLMMMMMMMVVVVVYHTVNAESWDLCMLSLYRHQHLHHTLADLNICDFARCRTPTTGARSLPTPPYATRLRA